MIKNLFLMLAFASFGCSLFAQDQIVKTNGEEIFGKVIRVNNFDVIYKKKENPDGPEYTELKANILFVKYENGQKDIFTTANMPVNAGMTSSIYEPRKRKNSVFVEVVGNGLYASVNYERKIFNSRNNNFTAFKIGLGPFGSTNVLNVTTTYNIGNGVDFFEFGGGVGVSTVNLFNGDNSSEKYNFFYATPTLGYRRQSASGFLMRAYVTTYVNRQGHYLNNSYYYDSYSYDYYPSLGFSIGYSL